MHGNSLKQTRFGKCTLQKRKRQHGQQQFIGTLRSTQNTYTHTLSRRSLGWVPFYAHVVHWPMLAVRSVDPDVDDDVVDNRGNPADLRAVGTGTNSNC